jgi:hypothetical protein
VNELTLVGSLASRVPRRRSDVPSALPPRRTSAGARVDLKIIRSVQKHGHQKQTHTDNALHFTEIYQAARIGEGLVFS